jgi:aminopeptidase-like protein
MSTRTKDLANLRSMLESSSLGDEIYSLIRELYPICRSIAGDGFRETLARIRKEIPLDVHEVPSGTQVFDWTVAKEWNIRDAYMKNTIERSSGITAIAHL